MPDRRDAEFAQILARQPAQNLAVNVIVAESGPILFEPEIAQPFAYMHLNCLRKACGGTHYNLAAAVCPGWPGTAAPLNALFPSGERAVSRRASNCSEYARWLLGRPPGNKVLARALVPTRQGRALDLHGGGPESGSKSQGVEPRARQVRG